MKRRSNFDREPRTRLYNRELKVDDLLIDDVGDFYRCVEAYQEHYSKVHGMHIINSLKFRCLTSKGYRSAFGVHADAKVDVCWIWHCERGVLV